jgi:hypothetical protein
MMNDAGLQTIEKVKRFLEGSQSLGFGVIPVDERYLWIETVLIRFKYPQRSWADERVIRWYIEEVSGYCEAQVSQLIKRYNQRGQLNKANYRRHQFPKKYMSADIALLVRTNELRDCLRGPATKKILGRECAAYGYSDCKDVSRICCSSLQFYVEVTFIEV